MALVDSLGLVVGAVALGLVHGIEPGHGWPVAATYALDQGNKWLHGLAASLLLGVGHLISSIAVVVAFFWAKSYFELTQVNDPYTVLGVTIGGPVDVFAGVLLIALGVREYVGGHGHSHGHDHSHGHGDHDGVDHGHGDDHEHAQHGDEGHDHGQDHSDGHSHDHSGGHDHDHSHGHSDHGHDGHARQDEHGQDGHEHHDDHGHDHDSGSGLPARLAGALPFVGGHGHAHGSLEESADRGLWGIAGFAFVLGFAHEEEFEIIAICAGSPYCLELMTIYALTVIFGIVALTLLLIAGYTRYEERVERFTPYLPLFSAVVLVLMGLGFVTGLF